MCVGWEWFERTRGHLSCLAWQEKLQVTQWGVGWAGERKATSRGAGKEALADRERGIMTIVVKLYYQRLRFSLVIRAKFQIS